MSHATPAVLDVSVYSVGQNKGALRVWLRGKMLERAGFLPATRYSISHRDGAVILTRDEAGYRGVSTGKSNEKEFPVIDLNSFKVLAAFAGLEHVRVTFTNGEISIEPLASELRARQRIERTTQRIEAGEALQVGSLAHGGGIMSHAVHAGFTLAGIKTELAFANELRPEMIEQSMSFNPIWTSRSIALCGKLQELAFDESIVSKLPQIDVLECGLPCSGASVAGRVKRRLVHPESHPEVGHLVVPFLSLVMRVNPTAIIFENVVPYAASASMDIIRSTLADMHYDVQEITFSGEEFNAIENRKRLLMIAVTRGYSLSFSDMIRPEKKARTFGEIMEALPLDDPRWSTMQGLKNKEIADKEKGLSFAMQIFTADSPTIGTLTKGLAKCRSTDPKIQHPTNPELLRNPTPTEHGHAKNIPAAAMEVIKGISATLAHELFGQSVIHNALAAAAELTGNVLKRGMKKALSVIAQDEDENNSKYLQKQLTLI